MELFFKMIKQNLRIKRFYGQSDNSVKTQVWIALIVHLLFLILKAETGQQDLLQFLLRNFSGTFQAQES